MKLLITELEKAYGKHPVLKNLSYEFEKGKIYGIIGRNGAGKTTLFNCIMGNVKINAGSVALCEDVVSPIGFEDVGMVSASPCLPEFLTGYEFVKAFMEIHKKDSSEEIINQYFDIVSLSEMDRHRLIKTYSYGMKNKIQILTCLITKPKIILLDEPLTSFDIVVSHEIKSLLLELKSNHIILLSTHILQLAEDVCDEIVLLTDGQLNKAKADQCSLEEHVVEALKEVR